MQLLQFLIIILYRTQNLNSKKMEENCLINQQLKNIIKTTNLRTHSESAFNMAFDKRLNYLVMLYRFNFQAVALHLIYQFPQYEYKINRRSIGYRWAQLHISQKYNIKDEQESQGQLIQQQEKEIAKLYPIKNHQYRQNRQYKGPQQYAEYPQQYQPQQNSSKKLQKALKMAQNLDDAENQGFILYKPRFIMDSQFSLQRQQFKQQKIQQIMSNSFMYDFGLFEGVAENNQDQLPMQQNNQRNDDNSKKIQNKESIQFEQKIIVNFIDDMQEEQKYQQSLYKPESNYKCQNQKQKEQYCFDVEDYQSD